MQKIRGFTLAEVLITLGIIGIVAAMTIPVIIRNAEKQTIITKVKESYSLLSQATQQINNDCGGDILSCLSNPTNTTQYNSTLGKEITDYYSGKLSVIKDCSNGSAGCWNSSAYKVLSGNTWGWWYDLTPYMTNARIVLKNGMSLGFIWDGPASAPMYFDINVDINGIQGPNQFGKDTFRFYYNANSKNIMPLTTSDCNTGANGWGCANVILNEGAINYY